MKEEDHIEALTSMILEGKKEEEELAKALTKILNFVDEDTVSWQYGIYEIVTPLNDDAIERRLTFLNARGKEGWILCTEVAFYDDAYGYCTRYTFRKRR